ncbi:MAG TPA: hypothetical protein GX521_01270 [Firmicutes bacterium]|nr:hypothetical protein [Bacillota bacterium]
MALVEAKKPEDVVLETNGIRFVLDPQVEQFAKGAVVDYKRSIFGRGFVVRTGRGGDC